MLYVASSGGVIKMRRLAIVVDGNRVAVDCAAEVMAITIVVSAKAVAVDLQGHVTTTTVVAQAAT